MRFKAKYLTRFFILLFTISIVKLLIRSTVEDKWMRVTPANNIKNEFYDNLLASDKEHLFQKKPKKNPFLNTVSWFVASSAF